MSENRRYLSFSEFEVFVKKIESSRASDATRQTLVEDWGPTIFDLWMRACAIKDLLLSVEKWWILMWTPRVRRLFEQICTRVSPDSVWLHVTKKKNTKFASEYRRTCGLTLRDFFVLRYKLHPSVLFCETLQLLKWKSLWFKMSLIFGCRLTWEVSIWFVQLLLKETLEAIGTTCGGTNCSVPRMVSIGHCMKRTETR